MEIALPSTGVQNTVVLNIHPENQDHNMVCSQSNPKHETNTLLFFYITYTLNTFLSLLIPLRHFQVYI